MASAGGIQAGKAYYELVADDKGVSAGLMGAQKKIAEFNSGLAQFGEKAGSDFSSKITKSLIAGFGVIALDGVLESMVQSLKSSGERNWYELGADFGQSITDGMRSIPVAGAVGEMIGMGLGSLGIAGTELGQEERLAKIRGEADKLNAAYGDVARTLEKMRATAGAGGDQSLLGALSFEDGLTEKLDALIKSGAGIDSAREAVQGLREEFQKMGTLKASEMFGDITEQLQMLSGAASADDRIIAEFAKKAAQVGNAFRAAGSPEAGAAAEGAINAGVNLAITDRNLAAIQKDMAKREADRAKDLAEALADLQKAADDFGKSETDLVRDRLGALGATPDQIGQGVAAQEALDRAKSRQDLLSQLASAQAAVGGEFGGGASSLGTFSSVGLEGLGLGESGFAVVDRTLQKSQRALEDILRRLREMDGAEFGS